MKQGKTKYIEIAALVIVVLMSLASNLPEHLMGHVVDRNVLLIALTASVVIALFRHLRFLLFMTIATLALGANVPGDLAATLGVSPVILIASLALLITIALLNYAFMLMPTGDKKSKMDTIFSRKAVLKAVNDSNQLRLIRLAEMNAQINFSHDGAVPIILAAEKGNPEIVQILVHHGADIRVRDQEGKTPMEVALAKGYARAAEILHYAAEGKALAAA